MAEPDPSYEPWWRESGFGSILLLALAFAAVAGLAAGFGGMIGTGALGAAVLGYLVWSHPPLGAWVLIGITPWIVGFERDAILPILRPNEAIFLLVAVVLIAQWVLRGAQFDFHWTKLDYVVALVTATGILHPTVSPVRTGPAGRDR